MSHLLKKRIKKAGLPPGTLFYIGERDTQETEIRIIEYDEKNFQDREMHDIDECKPPTKAQLRKCVHTPFLAVCFIDLLNFDYLLLKNRGRRQADPQLSGSLNRSVAPLHQPHALHPQERNVGAGFCIHHP